MPRSYLTRSVLIVALAYASACGDDDDDDDIIVETDGTAGTDADGTDGTAGTVGDGTAGDETGGGETAGTTGDGTTGDGTTGDGTTGDGTTGDGTTGDGAAGDGVDAAVDAAVPDTGTATLACDPNGEGACQNADDCPIIEGGTARQSATTCGIGCLGDADPEACANTCVVDETGLSTECSACYIDIVVCTRDNCIQECLADPESAACFDCQVSAGCRAEFDECSGLPPAERP
jgi:hypothetical protein